MGSRRNWSRAVWALVAMMLASSLAVLVAPASAASPNTNYSVSGYIDQPGGVSPMKAGVTVELLNSGTHQVLTTVTRAGGEFTFNSSNGGAPQPGWWGLWVPAQTHLRLGGSTDWAVIPNGSAPSYTFLNASDLTSTTFAGLNATASLYQFTGTINGTVTYGGNPADGVSVALVDPSVPDFQLNNTTTNSSGEFSFHAPPGSWVLESTYPGPQTLYNLTSVTVTSATIKVNPVIGEYLAQGYLTSKTTGARITSAGNVTLVDPATGAIYSEPTLPGFYTVGTYPAGFTGPAASKFVVLVSAAGYRTAGYPASVGSPATEIQKNLALAPEAPPAQYNTTIAFSPGFGKVNVTSEVLLGNDSVLPELANASVGQLWAQLGLDFNSSSLTFTGSTPAEWNAFLGWLRSSGPVFPAGEAGLEVNGTTYGQPDNATFHAPTPPSGPETYTSPASLAYGWNQSYNTTSSVDGSGTGSTYFVAFNFRHPVGPEEINYTVELPVGYTLAASTGKPSYSAVVPAGRGHTFTNFTLEARQVPAGAPVWGSANFTVVRYANISAIVNVSVGKYFAFSDHNVLNSTRGNYTVVVGAGQNVTFSALNSTYPDGTNGTYFQWDFGGAYNNTTTPSTYHTYSVAGIYHGWVRVTSSGGRKNETTFLVEVGAAAPTPVIYTNATAAQNRSSGGVPYVEVNWSSTLQFNLTGSISGLASNLSSYSGVLSDAVWSISAKDFNSTDNYSAGAKAYVNSNVSFQFLGNGLYFHNVTIGGATVAFYGWWYNVTLTLWDGQGHKAKDTLAVLVRDTEPPVPVVTLRDSAGKNISASGLVESANHTAKVTFDAQYSYDPHNGSVVRYLWVVNCSSNKSANWTKNVTSDSWTYWLPPQVDPYTVNLTVFDRAGNHAYATEKLTISINSSTRPVLSVTNLTAPSTMTDGDSYTIWANLTNTVGKNSTALNVAVWWYLTSTSGTGSRSTLVSNASVEFFNYTSGVVDTTPIATGVLPKLGYNDTVRVEIKWSPGRVGTFSLYANATASNQFVNTGPNVASVQVTLNANSTTTDIELAVLGVVAVVIVVLVVFYLLRRRRAPPSKGAGRAGLERGSGAKKPADEDEEDEES